MSPVSELHKEYTLASLNERDVDPNPFRQFEKWYNEAEKLPEPDAVALATASKEGTPSARMVFARGFDERGFMFYTNYESRKGKDLSENPNAALIFYWKELERQIRIEGAVSRVSRRESWEYFRSRPRGSRLGAWASRQSSVIQSREVLERRLAQYERKYRGKTAPLPPYWGGYRLAPAAIEFWQGRPSRLHDRIRYRKQENGTWLIERLSPARSWSGASGSSARSSTVALRVLQRSRRTASSTLTQQVSLLLAEGDTRQALRIQERLLTDSW